MVLTQHCYDLVTSLNRRFEEVGVVLFHFPTPTFFFFFVSFFLSFFLFFLNKDLFFKMTVLKVLNPN